MRRIIFFGLLLLLSLGAYASQDEGVPLRKPAINIADQASLQRGAKTFVSQCMTCHSLKYMRYEQMAEGLGLLDERGKVDEADLQKRGVMPAGAKGTDNIISALTAEAGKATYGIAPPDLSLIARERGIAWVFTYLHSFYQDLDQASGVNNLLVPGVAMPNILGPLQGMQKPVYHETVEKVDGEERSVKRIQSLELVAPGVMSPREFDRLTSDLVNFLDYVAEPVKLKRYRLGVWVLLFLSVFVILAYLLKQEYWKDVH
jgi:ubiquinol-cytochrome c reductase cytochrome c1 subunit